MLGENRGSNLNIFIDNFSSKHLFPNFSVFSINGPIELTFFPIGKNDKTVFRSDIKVTNAQMYISHR